MLHIVDFKVYHFAEFYSFFKHKSGVICMDMYFYNILIVYFQNIVILCVYIDKSCIGLAVRTGVYNNVHTEVFSHLPRFTIYKIIAHIRLIRADCAFAVYVADAVVRHNVFKLAYFSVMTQYCLGFGGSALYISVRY